MNLQKLFEAQQVLDEHIMNEHPELHENESNLDWKLLALQVELGECANEWRGFKKWSKNQRPRTEIFVDCDMCQGTGDANYEWVQEAAEGDGGHEYLECEECQGSGSVGPINPLLEEYVDCLHFILSIGIELGLNDRHNSLLTGRLYESNTPIIDLFMEVNAFLSELYWKIRLDNTDYEVIENQYKAIFENFVQLGYFLGFTQEQVEAAYFEKNKVNHQRQEEGY